MVTFGHRSCWPGQAFLETRASFLPDYLGEGDFVSAVKGYKPHMTEEELQA
jgi:hypothetical protein